MKVAIIGGAGAVGTSLVPYLARHHDVVVLDKRSSAHVSSTVRTHLGDATDSECVLRTIAACDGVIHLAGFVPRGSGPLTDEDVRHAFEVNALSVYIALCAARDVGVRSFVHMSTMSVYADYGQVPVDADSPADSVRPYGMSKRIAEHQCESFAATTDMTVTSLRLAVPTSDLAWPRWRSPSQPEAEPRLPLMGGRPVAALHPSDLAAATEWSLHRRGHYVALPVTGDAEGLTFVGDVGWRPRMIHPDLEAMASPATSSDDVSAH